MLLRAAVARVCKRSHKALSSLSRNSSTTTSSELTSFATSSTSFPSSLSRRPFSSSTSLQAKKKKKEGGSGLDATLEQIQGLYGEGSLLRLGTLGSKGDHGRTVDVISTGSLGLDLALGVGGLPKKRIVEIFGPESSGKTTIALSVIAEAQKKGGTCCFIDVEHALDPSWARKLGVRTDDLLFSQPDSAEEALEIADTLVSSGHVSVLVIDSVAALVPRSEIEGEMGDAQVGVQARLMSHALRKLTASIAKSNTLVIFINQLRMKIGVLFGNPETTSGGTALKFYASVRLDVRRVGQIKVGDDIIGNQIRVKVAKNKVAPPYKQAEFDILFDQGFSKAGEVLDIGVREGLIVKSGAWYTMPQSKDDLAPLKLGQGRDKSRQYLEQHPDLATKIEASIRERVLARASKAASVDEVTAAVEEEEEEEEPEIVAEEGGRSKTDE